MKEFEAKQARESLLTALLGPLPGISAWRPMIPPYRGGDEMDVAAGRAGERHAAVLILLNPGPDGLRFPLLERASGLRHHAGQISLPGGALEAGETPLECAIRETKEEIGLIIRPPEVIGALSPLSALPSGFRVHPFIAFTEGLSVYNLQREEVDNLFEIPLAALTDPACIATFSMRRDDKDWSVPCYDFGGRKVWGLTAMILAEFAWIVNRYQKHF